MFYRKISCIYFSFVLFDVLHADCGLLFFPSFSSGPIEFFPTRADAEGDGPRERHECELLLYRQRKSSAGNCNEVLQIR